jgi:hypothetical protein
VRKSVRLFFMFSLYVNGYDDSDFLNHGDIYIRVRSMFYNVSRAPSTSTPHILHSLGKVYIHTSTGRDVIIHWLDNSLWLCTYAHRDSWEYIHMYIHHNLCKHLYIHTYIYMYISSFVIIKEMILNQVENDYIDPSDKPLACDSNFYFSLRSRRFAS